MMHVSVYLKCFLASVVWLVSTVVSPVVIAQGVEPLPPEPVTPLPEPEPLPAPEDLLPQPSVPSDLPEQGIAVPGTFVVSAFRVVGSTVFSESELGAVTADYVDRPITFSELFEARAAITQLYVDAGYISSGAFIPSDQLIGDGVVTIQVVEGGLEDIQITGLKHLDPGYISSRIEVRNDAPLNVNRLVESLQLLQINPLIENLSAELAAGTQTGSSILNLQVKEAPRWGGTISLDNFRSTSVGSFQRRATLSNINLLGKGDSFVASYGYTNGSDTWDLGYTIPLGPHNTSLAIDYSTTDSRIIQDAFEVLDIESDSTNLVLSLRQPVIETPTEELALELAFDYRRSESTFQFGDIRLPLQTSGSDDGVTRISAIRFNQEWTQRSAREVLALRSQFSLGTDWFDATRNSGDRPDGQFLSWQGQAQWVKAFDNDQLFLARLTGQLSDGPLLSLEQFRLGGQGSVRGYRQDQATTDNGVFASVEMRFPLFEVPSIDSAMQIAPFIDYGVGWNNGEQVDPDPNNLLSMGTGLLWQTGDRISARLDFGMPLIDPGEEGNSFQESGFLFSITGRLF
ncbi:ShlB/FhaC/HecB family hemolysin secretion/activation protein [Leptothoe sp. LEGE 181152]|nr:ShlB/FhaC/HecB family hemolysin secretion/activation protein [Adonisia turfae]MDV3352238.1 ShlB/FhaC/HecB family hemolysin secretion/activation protein [Leptothoe sp. LEGE 181152]